MKILKDLYDSIWLQIQPTPFKRFLESILSIVIGFNYSKYWNRRAYVVNPETKNTLLKLYYLYYIKRQDAKRLSSFGTSYNKGAVFKLPPKLPHGANGIIVAHDAMVGSNVTIHQQVTIASGGTTIGDNVFIGAGAKVLGGGKNW